MDVKEPASQKVYRHRRDAGQPLIMNHDHLLCQESDCDRSAGRTGFCNPHYKRNWVRELAKLECTALECTKKQITVGFCFEHNLERRDVISRSKLSRRISKDGYVYVYNPEHSTANSSGHCLEHRMIMSDSLRRPLLSHENVHHKNGQKVIIELKI